MGVIIFIFSENVPAQENEKPLRFINMCEI